MQLPLNVSPVSASFFGPMRLGIRLVLCVACSLICVMMSFDDDMCVLSSHLLQGGKTHVFAFLCFNCWRTGIDCLMTDDIRQN